MVLATSFHSVPDHGRYPRVNIMKYKKGILIFFSILDVFLFLRFAKDINILAEPFLLTQLKSIFLISLVLSALGLFYQKVWGYVICYIQFPLSYVFVLFSFGFLTYFLPHTIAIIVAMILEIARLVLIVIIHFKDNKKPSGNPAPPDS